MYMVAVVVSVGVGAKVARDLTQEHGDKAPQLQTRVTVPWLRKRLQRVGAEGVPATQLVMILGHITIQQAKKAVGKSLHIAKAPAKHVRKVALKGGGRGMVREEWMVRTPIGAARLLGNIPQAHSRFPLLCANARKLRNGALDLLGGARKWRGARQGPTGVLPLFARIVRNLKLRLLAK